MKEQKLKIITLLSVLFLLDLVRPLRYSFLTEFLFIGIVFVCMYYTFTFSVMSGISFGYLKGALSTVHTPLYIAEFCILALLIKYILSHVQAKFAKPIVLVTGIAVHIACNGVYQRQITPLFYLLFFIHTSVIFLLTDYLLRRWINVFTVKSI